MSDWELLRPLPKVTRVEVINSAGRAYAARDLYGVSMVFQDDGATLKIFVDTEEERE